ncbi:MAG: hypothetical protein H6708_16585 [Kofleriaceae bacterium]|nr:hypothetical protein [Kofleriaceae bacterium]
MPTDDDPPTVPPLIAACWPPASRATAFERALWLLAMRQARGDRLDLETLADPVELARTARTVGTTVRA